MSITHTMIVNCTRQRIAAMIKVFSNFNPNATEMAPVYLYSISFITIALYFYI